MYGQSLGKHQQEESSRWKLCFSCTPRDSNDWSISSLPACAMVETSSPVYLPSNFMVRLDQSSVRNIAGTSLWGHPSSSGLPKSQRASLCEMIKISSWSLVLFWISTDYHQARLIFLAKVQRQPQTFQQRGKWELGQLFIPSCPSISCCPTISSQSQARRSGGTFQVSTSSSLPSKRAFFSAKRSALSNLSEKSRFSSRGEGHGGAKGLIEADITTPWAGWGHLDK